MLYLKHLARWARRMFIRSTSFEIDLYQFTDSTSPGSHFTNFPKRLVGENLANIDRFSHYDATDFLTFKTIDELGHNRKILDLGGRKGLNAILALKNDVHAIVLGDPDDEMSDIRYQVQDAADKLPYPNDYFDFFTSNASLHLIGFGRYGDRVCGSTLENFLNELNRVMKKESVAVVSLPIGPDFIYWREGRHFTVETLREVFHGWNIENCLLDNRSSTHNLIGNRYESILDKGDYLDKITDYSVGILKLKKV